MTLSANGWGEAGWWKQNDQQWDHPRRFPPASGAHSVSAVDSNLCSWVAAGSGQNWGERAYEAAGKPPYSDTVAETVVTAEAERKMKAEKEEAALLEKKMLAEKRVAEQIIAAMTKNESQQRLTRATLSKETARKVSAFSDMEFYN